MSRRSCVVALCIVLGMLGSVPVAHAADWYAAPADIGTGDCATAPNACDVAQALGNVAAGDTLWFTDGTYTPPGGNGWVVDTDGTAGNRITLDAVNPLQAILTDDNCGEVDDSDRIMDIRGDYITVRNLAIDGCETTWDVIRVFGNAGSPNPQSVGVILENLRLTDMGRVCFNAFNTDGLIIRNSYCNRTGFQGPGEGFYLSSASNTHPVTNSDIYANIIQSGTNNFMDYKDQASNNTLHHNMDVDRRLRAGRELPPLQGADDGILRSEGNNPASGNSIEDMIIINANSAYSIRGDDNRTDVLNSVWMDVTPTEWVDDRTAPAATIIGGNTLHNSGETVNATVVQTPANTFGANQAAADAEVDRILQEVNDEGLGLMGGLAVPTIASCEATDADTIVTTWANASAYALAEADNAQFVVVGSVNGAQTEGATIVSAALETTTTLTGSSLDGTDVITLDTGYDAVRMDTNFGGEIDLRSQANGAPVTCTNSIGGGPPPVTYCDLNQSQFAFRRWGVPGETFAAPRELIRRKDPGKDIPVPPGSKIQMRASIVCDDPDGTDGSPTVAFRPYACDGTCATPANWYELTGTFGGNLARLTTDNTVTSPGVTTEQLNCGTFVAGVNIDSTLGTYPTLQLSDGECTEQVAVIEIDSTAVAGTSVIRIGWQQSDGTDLDSSVNGTIYVGAPWAER